ncbi:MAG TPA: LecA/PA-IL family lectin [Vicinamibacterales bacterium]|nr:LecA/PA-IL family lectin [Vicinamibacterales bacterium]
MIRRLIISAALAVVAGSGILAVERATFVLTDGQRKTGDITSRPPEGQNPATAAFSIMVSPGQEETFLASQVAVIEFAGNPPANELAQLPATGHFMVLRNGSTGRGTFLNLVGGDTLVWRSEQGDEQRYAVRDLSRVYLNPQSAKVAYNAAGTSAVATSGSGPATIQVPATEAWTDTGIDVRQGDRFAISATGQVAYAAGRMSNAGGDPAEHNPAFPVGNWPVGALVAKIGASKPFPIGAAQTLAMPTSGRLMLGVNDTILTDNSGAFQVTITRVQ